MEPTNHPFKKKNDLPNFHEDMFQPFIFRGVSILDFLDRFGSSHPQCDCAPPFLKALDCGLLSRDICFSFTKMFRYTTGVFTAMFLFPTCQVRVVRFYVSLFSFSSSFSFSFSSSSSSSSDLNHDLVSSVWHAGPQPRSCEFSVACRTSTTIL